MKKSWSKGLSLLKELMAIDTQECIEWPLAKNNGYPRIYYRAATRDYRKEYANRLVCEMTYGAAPDDHEAAHSCGNPGCINPKHLRWATRSENQMDRVAHKTSNRGERQGQSKLKEDQVLMIVFSLYFGLTKDLLADYYNVSVNTIQDIYMGRTWNWLTNQRKIA